MLHRKAQTNFHYLFRLIKFWKDFDIFCSFEWFFQKYICYNLILHCSYNNDSCNDSCNDIKLLECLLLLHTNWKPFYLFCYFTMRICYIIFSKFVMVSSAKLIISEIDYLPSNTQKHILTFNCFSLNMLKFKLKTT